MKLAIMLNDNTFINTDMDGYLPEEIANTLNNRQINAFTVGDAVVNKNIVAVVMPAAKEEQPNVKIQINNGQVLNEYVETYDAAAYTDKINDPSTNFIVVGSSVIHKQIIRTIKPIEETTV